MVIERAEFAVTPGAESSFEAAMQKGVSLLAGAAGCHRVTLSRGIEQPDTYQLLLVWDSVDAHVAFTSTPEFDEFRTVAGPFFAGKPNTAHFQPVIERP